MNAEAIAQLILLLEPEAQILIMDLVKYVNKKQSGPVIPIPFPNAPKEG